MSAPQFRTEKDSMGEMQIPADAYYGAQTGRAVENFPISDLRFSRRFIAAMGLIKWSCAEVNHKLGFLDDKRKTLIQQAADEVIAGKLDAQFVVDIFQTGSGTSTNMNTNEVIASRANEIATGKRGGKDPVHPNDHVNMEQSSNDSIPTAIHVSAAVAINESLVPALEHLQKVLEAKAKQYDDVVKIGRTHLQDATPIRLGQEISGYAAQAKLGVMRAHKAINALRELPLGGTAVGTGINSHPDFAKQAIAVIARKSGIDFVEAANHFEAQASKDGVVEASGQLKTIAISLSKIANDIRWLSSGPRCGIGEINIPSTQPGSSIMPGKVNPVMSEMALMVAAQVVGNDTTIAFAGSGLGSTFELNVMMPVMAYNLLQSIDLLAKAARVFADRCAAGIEADKARCEGLVEQSLAMCTSLAPVIGYDKAADIAKESHKTGKTVRQVAAERKLMSDAELNKVLDARRMTEPQADMVGSGGG
ncbi:class II fumarate hydratase [Humisphaera borealis]|uniref:Fumarate hydratase class II n=1 Tax=Humisphaera borealis TaxID=2807512 RepID=A0A7M2WUB3_9BACT|nr:class II fumarate hydratase [Humisphaera borealis]QOV89098.1 class II fumarate hydratase [Humisphaera borealis]